MKVVSLIPARGGSKSIPKKNLVEVMGVPLIDYAIKASTWSGVDETWVSTDSKEIKEESLVRGVGVIDRPKKIAKDNSPTEETIKHFLDNISCDIVVLIQPTSPMILADDINKGLEKFRAEKLDSLFSATRPGDMLIWQEQYPDLVPINYDSDSRGTRQDRLQSVLIETGGFYIFSRKSFLKYNNRLGGKIGYVEIPFWRSFEVDTLEDLRNIEKLMRV